jgi:bacteriocin biosynthesis cyclodehydratase domain-containing protein
VGATSDPAGPADLVVLTGEAHRDLAAAQLVREGVPHLYVEARETSGVVGPLVLPGRSACARCLALHRTDRDPAWAAVAAQLATPGAADSACEVVLATALAATAAAQVLCHLDGVEPPTVDGTIEIRLPDLRSRRRSWHVHPLCGCCWPPS